MVTPHSTEDHSTDAHSTQDRMGFGRMVFGRMGRHRHDLGPATEATKNLLETTVETISFAFY